MTFPWFGYQAIGLIELFAVLLIAVYLGRGPALVAAFASAFSWNYLFIDPRLTLAISEAPDLILFLLYFVIALLAGNLTARLRQQERLSSYNAERSAALYALAHDTASAVNMDEVLATGVSQIGRVFDAEVAILLPKGEHLERQPHMASTFGVDDKDFAVAAWVFENGKRAGTQHINIVAGVSPVPAVADAWPHRRRDRHPYAPAKPAQLRPGAAAGDLRQPDCAGHRT